MWPKVSHTFTRRRVWCTVTSGRLMCFLGLILRRALPIAASLFSLMNNFLKQMMSQGSIGPQKPENQTGTLHPGCKQLWIISNFCLIFAIISRDYFLPKKVQNHPLSPLPVNWCYPVWSQVFEKWEGVQSYNLGEKLSWCSHHSCWYDIITAKITVLLQVGHICIWCSASRTTNREIATRPPRRDLKRPSDVGPVCQRGWRKCRWWKTNNDGRHSSNMYSIFSRESADCVAGAKDDPRGEGSWDRRWRRRQWFEC